MPVTMDSDNLARSVSNEVGIPNEVPFFAVSEIALITLGCACPKNHRAPRRYIIYKTIAILIEDVSPFSS